MNFCTSIFKYKRRHKVFCFTLIAGIAALVLSNLIIWEAHTKKLLTYQTGDLSRKGYLSTDAVIKKTEVDLPRQHIKQYEFRNQKLDGISVGDSFSNGISGGKNPYYQDYIASIYNYSILNVEGKDLLEKIIALLNSGWLKKHRPKFIILQAVERECITQFSRNFNFDKKYLLEDVESEFRAPAKKFNEKPKISFINNGNAKFLIYNFLYHFSDNALISDVLVKKLNSRLFTIEHGDKLIFYKNDINKMKEVTDRSVQKLNSNMNELARRLGKLGIRLYFMPAVDKYDLYSGYIINNTYPQSTFFERLRPLPKDYYLVDTKKILSDEIKKGEKDIFYPDDTHWSWKASKKIAGSVRF